MTGTHWVRGASAACFSVVLALAAGCSSPSTRTGFEGSASTTGGTGSFLPRSAADSGAAKPATTPPANDDPGATSEDAGTPTNDDAAPTAPCSSTSIAFTVVDYFSGSPVEGVSATVDGAAADMTMCLGTGVHPVVITASGYATYNGAVQVPGGSTARTIQLFPATPSMLAWLAVANSDRQSNGAGPVQLDNALTIAAWDHAIDMGTQGYFAHFDPHGFAPTTRSLLLGSMVMGMENIAEGYESFQDADSAFMGEKAMLPNQSPSDCAANDDLAGHYCNIVASSHNWVGLAIANMPNAGYGSYYDQEFGDLYGYYDTTVVPTEPALGTSASLTLMPASGQMFQYEYVQTMPAPTPIPIATLNADPTCSSMCPSNDAWYPTGNTQIGEDGPLAYSPQLGDNQIVFPTLETQAMPFCGASAYAAFWAGGNVMPDTYGAESKSYLVQ